MADRTAIGMRGEQMNGQVKRLPEKMRTMLKFALKAASDSAASASDSHKAEWAENWAVMMAYSLDLLLHDPRVPAPLRERLRPAAEEWQQFAEQTAQKKFKEWSESIDRLTAGKTHLDAVLVDILRL